MRLDEYFFAPGKVWVMGGDMLQPPCRITVRMDSSEIMKFSRDVKTLTFPDELSL